ncbi:hypothetical protein [Litchfieldia salsa]|uniref:Lipoprotein n=1 Tax=Litchfieldia salsa TaxID=930152 RepID=A0A1H0VE44_9BACI|nr:hypothetical protein [Litchfieldia salsa]SDP76485.1 hypothetical protein SAMN05216565_106209 [Litchfieldia salsa]
MNKNRIIIAILCMTLMVLSACGGKDKAKDEEKKEEPTPKVQQTEEKVVKLGSLGFTTDELQSNWNEAQAEMEESGEYRLDGLPVENGEFKANVSEGLILEGIVNEGTNEVARVSLVKKYEEVNEIEDSLNQFEDTIAAFFLLVASTNKNEKVQETEISKLMSELGLVNDKDEIIDGKANLNNVAYTAKETERGLVITATEKASK